jgi:DNA (cytosine-5)-methyltransferase 1
MKLKVGSMFAGIGGIDLGFKQAGYNIVWANDFDEAACKTYRENFGNEYLIEQDIHNIDVDELADIDILVAGFPCQPFSIAGQQRGFQDKRGNLFFEITRVIDKKRPPIVFLENVKNLIEHDNGKTFLVIYNTLAQFGYALRYKVLNALEYGNLPQNRERIFIVAFRDFDICQKFKFPEPIERTVSLFDVIDKTKKQASGYYYNNSPYLPILEQAITDTNCIYKFTDFNVRKSRAGICPTLTANMGTYPNRVPIIKDDYGIRKLTPLECLALQGFPAEYHFSHDIKIEDAYKQAGNTVCVPVVKRIAESIKNVLD